MLTWPERKRVGLLLGPLAFVAMLLGPLPASMPAGSQEVAAVALLMTIWWITEAVPIPVTALLPIVLFPSLGVMKASAATAPYANHLIYLFLGGFLIAVTMEKWNLHRRIALHTIRLVGTTPNRVILGFMLATAFLSMWISNTATTMMMLPIGMAVIGQAQHMTGLRDDTAPDRHSDGARFATALMLGIAYAGSIGGVATLIGTPPNAILAGVYESSYGTPLGFAEWMLFGLPLSCTMLAIAWIYLTRVAYPGNLRELPGGRKIVCDELSSLGPMSQEEKRVLAVFCLVASAWVGRGLLKPDFLQSVSDSTIAIAGAVLLFLIPAPSRRREALLDWQTAAGIPWDIIVLFGGGFALANGFSESGLTHWIAGNLGILKGTGSAVLVLCTALVVIFLTEVTSNTATASLTLPVMGALAAATDTDPLGLMVTTAIAASFAFMLPVATPPNAIVYSSRHVQITEMARTGFAMNLAGCAVLYLFVLYLLPLTHAASGG